jgi:hypothetical protein
MRRYFPVVGGFRAYVPRGPIPAVGGAELASRVVDLVEALRPTGLAVLAADPEVPATDTAYVETLGAAGFHQIEEIQASRHRVRLPLGPGIDEPAAFERVAKSTRQRIRQAEGASLSVVRHDTRMTGDGPGDGFAAPAEPARQAFERFYDLLHATGERRGFEFGGREDSVAWWSAAHAAGHLVFLEGWDGAEPLAGLVLHRHGERLSTVHAADRAERRRDHPGVTHLLRWRAIQLAIREGRAELDLGGVDVPGARREPREGEPTYGLYQHKRSFGGEWLALCGAYERETAPTRHALGRVLAGLARSVDR